MGRMNSLLTPDVRRILILRDDRLYANALAHSALQVFPAAQITIATSVHSAAAVLAQGSFDLLVTGLGTSVGGDVLELLMWWVNRRVPNAQRVMVVTAERQYRLLEALRKLSIAGVFDSGLEPPEGLSVALRTVTTGGRYWSRSLQDCLTEARVASTPLSFLLTNGEAVVLSIVGDGSDDADAARQLGISSSTVSTIRRDLHRKLGVQHRGELIRFAAQNGFVQFTPSGIVRPGFALFSAEYYERRRLRARPQPPPLPPGCFRDR
jgi:DNA-binding NarL/FixJ family response regulator